jgi:hypothetical protein
MSFVIDALHGFSVNPGRISAPGFPAWVHGRVFYSENSGLERIIFFLLHYRHLDLWQLLGCPASSGKLFDKFLALSRKVNFVHRIVFRTIQKERLCRVCLCQIRAIQHVVAVSANESLFGIEGCFNLYSFLHFLSSD